MAWFYFCVKMGQRPLGPQSCALWSHKSCSFQESPLHTRERMRMKEARELSAIGNIIVGRAQGSLRLPRAPGPLRQSQGCSDGGQTVGNFGQGIRSPGVLIFLLIKVWGVVTVVIRL